MRRLTIEIVGDELDKFREATQFHKIKWFEVLHFLELDDEIALTFRVQFHDPRARMSELFRGRWKSEPRFELLKREKGGVLTYFGRIKLDPKTAAPSVFDFFTIGGYFVPPYEFSDERFRVTYLGSPREVERFVRLVNRTGARYKVVASEKVRPSTSPLARLTEKQRRALATAHRMGYYDVPRKASIEQVAKVLRVARSTADVELRRAERRLLIGALGRA